MSNIEKEYQQVSSDLQQVGADLRRYSDDTKRDLGAVQSRMANLEQIIADAAPGLASAGFQRVQSLSNSMLQAIDENSAFAALREWNQGTCRLSVDAPIRAALTHDDLTGAMPSNPERGAISTGGQRVMRLLDALPSRPVETDAVEFVQISTSDEAAEQEAEGDAKAEIDLAGELVRADIATVAGHTTTSRQVLQDNAQLQQAIDRVIQYKLLTKLEAYLVGGSPSGKIRGLTADSTVFTPTIGVTPADIIGESLTRQADAGFMPNLVLMNSLDWFELQLTRKVVGEDDYTFGSPTMPLDPSLWNQIVVPSPAVPTRTAYTVDTGHVTVLDRMKPTILLSNSHSDYMTRNLLLILGELRAGLEVTDTGAVNKITLPT